MAKVLGIGGVFFKTQPTEMQAWLKDNLGIEKGEGFDGAVFPWKSADGARDHATIVGLFDQDTSYFEPSSEPFMVNFIVDDLDAMLADLRTKGCSVHDKTEEMDGIGRFGWVDAPGGVKIELWQPA
ncbi:MAG: VOC family protein [Pseudomonadota bacterium]